MDLRPDQKDWRFAPSERAEPVPTPRSGRFDLLDYVLQARAAAADDPSLEDPRGVWHRLDGVPVIPRPLP